jgi:hypothetical protein
MERNMSAQADKKHVSPQTFENANDVVRKEKATPPLPGVTRNAGVLPGASCGIYSSKPLRAGFDPFMCFDQ